MQTVYLLLALLNFTYGLLFRIDIPTNISLERHKHSSILHSINDSSLLTEQDSRPYEREDTNDDKTLENLNLINNNQNNKHISITKRETGDIIKERSENKTTIGDIKHVSLINKASDKHKIYVNASNKSNSDHEKKKTIIDVKDSSNNHIITNQSHTTRPVKDNKGGHKNNNLMNHDAPHIEHKDIKRKGNLNAESKNQTTVNRLETATDTVKVIREDIINTRSKRSNPGLMKMLKNLFTKNKTENNTVATDNVETPTTPIARSSTTTNIRNEHTLEDKKINNDEKDKMVADKQYVDKLLSKLDRTLQMLNEKLADEQYTNDSGYVIVKITLTLDDSSKPRFKRDADSTKLTEDEINVNATETNDTKSTKDIAQTIDLNFKEVQNEMVPIKKIKDKFSSNKMYKVGYIIASLETLELTLKKMVDELSFMELNKARALKILDTVKLSKAVVSNLMRHLDEYSKYKSE